VINAELRARATNLRGLYISSNKITTGGSERSSLRVSQSNLSLSFPALLLLFSYIRCQSLLWLLVGKYSVHSVVTTAYKASTMDTDHANLNDFRDRDLATRMRRCNYEKYKSLVRMHLSFELELNTDE